MQSMAGSLIRSGESSQRISSSSPEKLDKRLTIICFMHNWDLPFLRIRLRFLLVSCRNRCDNDLAMGSRWKDQRCWAVEKLIFRSNFNPTRANTNPIFAAPKMPNRNAPSFFTASGRFANHSLHSTTKLSKSMIFLVILNI
jgi:hypothetical protein